MFQNHDQVILINELTKISNSIHINVITCVWVVVCTLKCKLNHKSYLCLKNSFYYQLRELYNNEQITHTPLLSHSFFNDFMKNLVLFNNKNVDWSLWSVDHTKKDVSDLSKDIHE